MEAIKNGLCKNLTPAQLWSGARFFLLLNLSLIICAAALNFYCAPNHFVFGGTTGLSIVLATCFPALSVSTFMWITNAVLDVLGCVFLGIKTMGWTLYSSFMLSFYSSINVRSGIGSASTLSMLVSLRSRPLPQKTLIAILSITQISAIGTTSSMTTSSNDHAIECSPPAGQGF